MNPQTATNTEYFQSRAHITLWASIRSGDAGERTDQPRLFDGTSASVDRSCVYLRRSPTAERPLRCLESSRILVLGTAARADEEMGRTSSWVPQFSFSLETRRAQKWWDESGCLRGAQSRMEGFFSPRRRGPNGLRAFVLRQIQDSARKHHKQTSIGY